MDLSLLLAQRDERRQHHERGRATPYVEALDYRHWSVTAAEFMQGRQVWIWSDKS